MNYTGLNPADILLPKTDDLTAWATVACDQFTSEREYWERLGKEVEGKRTTLDLVLPEIYLGDGTQDRIKKINENMKRYVSEGVLGEAGRGFVLVVRSTPFVKRRIGLVGAIDLEEYDYAAGTNALCRATEGTIEERIPPRLAIRRDAPMEFSHVMILFDDEKRAITEKLYEERESYRKVYDFELNMGGGHIEGWFIDDADKVLRAFSGLLDEDRLKAKYGSADKFAFAVGDGNHSLATAKAHWNNIKRGISERERKTHPARFALAEFVNVYDEGIYFEPIYRLVSGVDAKKFTEGIKKVNGGNMRVRAFGETVDMKKDNTLPDGIREADAYIKEYIEANGGAVDYVHGEKNIINLVDARRDAAGVLFDKLDKSDLFGYISAHGAFPRKTFSMGEGVEKRYYLEGKRIIR